MKKTLLIFFLFIIPFGYSQSVEAFQIYNSKGKKVSIKKFLKSVGNTEILLFGEYHDNPIAHWLQLKTIQHLFSTQKVQIGAEMLEADQQIVLNQYLAGEINQREMDSLIQLWSNYHTDYKPIVDFAKEKQIPVIATNVPRVHASYVYRHGLEELEASLDNEERQFVAPLPIPYDETLPGYQAMLKMMGHTPNPNFPKAQAIKDATMAHFILKNRQINQVFIHLNGAYHSNNYEGIFWYLKQYQPSVKIITISTIQQKNVTQFESENKGLADFILVVDEEMIKTH